MYKPSQMMIVINKHVGCCNISILSITTRTQTAAAGTSVYIIFNDVNSCAEVKSCWVEFPVWQYLKYDRINPHLEDLLETYWVKYTYM